jgi:hypothetical protein
MASSFGGEKRARVEKEGARARLKERAAAGPSREKGLSGADGD